MGTSSSPKTKEPTVFLQAYVYDRASILPFVSQCLQVLFGETGTWACTCISRIGARKLTSKKSVADCLSKVTHAFPQGFNQLEISGKDWNWPQGREALSATIIFRPSPLSRTWAPVGELLPEEHTRPTLRKLWSARSYEQYVLLNKLKRDPASISIAIKYPSDVKPSTRTAMLKEFRGFIESLSAIYEKGYIGFIDPVELPSARHRLSQPNKSICMDLRFDMPHMITFGPKSVVGEFHGDIVAEYPQIDLFSEDIGICKVVAFEDRSELEQIDLPKWHDVHP